MEDYPRNWVEFDERFSSEEACIAYLISLRWPKGFACPKCGGDRALAEGPAGDGLYPLPSRDLDHGRHAVREDSQTAESMVQGHVVGHQPEDGCECPRTAASPGVGQLRDRLVVASQASSRHGSTGAGSAQRLG